MEELTKQQLILLALLVSFVTSIAASIATATLLDQAPPKVTQTIHRVVERTVETVTPSDNGEPTITQEKTIIVKEEDAITDAINSVSPSLVKLYITPDAAENDNDEFTTSELSTRFRGVSVAVDKNGKILTTSSVVLSETLENYDALLSDGTTVTAIVSERNVALSTTILVLEIPAGTSAPDPVDLGTSEVLTLGQTVLGLGGTNSVNVGIGIIGSINKEEDGSVSDISASIVSDVPGMVLVNLFGEVVGFAENAGDTSYVPTSVVALLPLVLGESI